MISIGAWPAYFRVEDSSMIAIRDGELSQQEKDWTGTGVFGSAGGAASRNPRRIVRGFRPGSVTVIASEQLRSTPRT